jgi:hypothetical protein
MAAELDEYATHFMLASKEEIRQKCPLSRTFSG